MARRSSRPSLYEVAQQRLNKSGQGVDHPDGVSGAAPSQPRIAPGSSLRLPLGYVFVGVVLVIGTVIGAWWSGRGAGVEEVQRDIRAAGQGRVEIDPMADRPSAEWVAPPAHEPSQVVDASNTASSTASSPPPPPEPEVAVPETHSEDPRIPGRWYFVLAETRKGGAEEIAAFCRQQGLEVAVVSGHNARLAKVIALPGLTSARATDPAFHDLDSRIGEVGRRWRESGRRTSFADRYLQRKGDTP